MLAKLLSFFHDDKGTTAIEYGLICALVVALVAVALPLLGGTVQGLYMRVVNAFPG